MERTGYTLIQDWMLDLPLSYREIAIYAIIYGFSQDGETRFEGSIGYLAAKTKSTKNTARTALHKLMDEGLIDRTIVNKNGVEFHTYKVNLSGTAKIVGGVQKLEGGTQKIAPNNKEYNKDINTHSNKGNAFVCPSLPEVEAYCRERGNAVNAEAFIAYYESNGWMIGKNRMKDWKAAVRTWEQRDRMAKPQVARKAQPRESNRQRLDRIAQELLGGFSYDGNVEEQ